MIEEVLSVKCQVLSRASPPGSLPRPLTSSLTLPTCGGTPAAEGLSYQTNPNLRGRDGARRTNKPNLATWHGHLARGSQSWAGRPCHYVPIRRSAFPEGLSCETNPICHLARWDPQNPSRQTKPISPGRCRAGTPNLRGADYAKQTQFRRDTAWGTRAGVRLCQTKPNLGGLGYLEERDTGHRANAPNKPN